MEVALLFLGDESDSQTLPVCPSGSTPDTVYIVLGIVGNIVVDDYAYIVDVDPSRYDVSGHEYIHIAVFEVAHHLFALGLLQIGVHIGHIETHLAESGSQLTHFELGRGENNGTLRSRLLEELAEYRQLLRFVTNVCALHDALGRTADGDLHLYRIP